MKNVYPTRPSPAAAGEPFHYHSVCKRRHLPPEAVYRACGTAPIYIV